MTSLRNETSIEKQTPEVEVTKRETLLSQLVEAELAKFGPEVNSLLVLRHKLFDVVETEYDTELSIEAQLYEDSTYNVPFINHDMGLRNGNALEYHQTTEKYDRGFSNTHAERDEEYRRAILNVAQNLGFISKYAGVATEPIDQKIGILDSELEPIEEKVAAIVINGAAGMSNVKRVRDALRNIENGRIETDTVIITAGTRPVSDAEKARMKSFFKAGDTEFESMKQAVVDLTGAEFMGLAQVMPVEYGEDLTQRVETIKVVINDKEVTIHVAESPFDNTRIMDDGKPAKRINTEETFLAALPFLKGKEGAVVMQSHDTWTPWQNLIGQKVFGLNQGRNVYPAGPFNAERVYEVRENGRIEVDIAAPQDVLDEIIKTYRQIVRMAIESRS